MRRRVVVTGLGVVSPLGSTVKSAWTKLISGGHGIVKLDGQEYEKLPCRIAAKIQGLDLSEYVSKSELRTMSPATSIGLAAGIQSLKDASWAPQDETSKQRTGVCIGMGMVDLQDICSTGEALKRSYSRVSPYFVPRILPNMTSGQLSIKYGFQGPNHTVSTACATGCHAIGDGFRMLRNGDADVMVCGASEACISPLSIAGFCRLRALSTSFNDKPGEASRPFDEARDGFVMGEGAAVLVLEELDHALRRGVRIYCEILGYGLSGDACHLTAPHEQGKGAVLAMKRALQDAGVSPRQVSYINAHATSTPLGDEIELSALHSLFSVSPELSVSSTKGSHGHLLGSAGSLETVFTVLALFHSTLPPTINLSNPCSSAALLKCPTSAQNWSAPFKVAIKNSFGFGGTNASLCLAEYKI